MAETNSYAILGVAKSSTSAEIKTAYVNLVKKYDPEKHTERFMVIQAAYDRLKNPKTRAQEDVYVYNMASGEFLFQDGEKWASEEAPDDDEFEKLRKNYLENALNEDARRTYIKKLCSRAHYLVTRKKLNDAIRDWSEVLEHEPSNSRARQNLKLACSRLGISYALHGLDDEAIFMLERALKIDPDNTDLIHNLALLSEKAEDAERAGSYWEETINRWKKLLSKDPDDEYLRQLITEALSHQDDLSDLLAQRRAAPPPRKPTEMNSKVVSKLPPIAKDTDDEKQPIAASEGNKPAVAPSTEEKQGVGGAPLTATLERYRDIVSLNPNDFDAHYQLCNKLMEEKLWGEAEEELHKMAKKHPKNTEVWNMMGWAMLNNGKKDQAFNCWKKSMVIDPKNPSTREQLVRAHLKMGQAFRNKGIFTQALVHFKKLIQLMPKSAEVHMEIAVTYDMKGDVRSAVSEYQKVLSLDPKNKVARKALNDLRMKR